MTSAALQVDGLAVRYGETVALRGVSITVGHGEVIAEDDGLSVDGALCTPECGKS